MDHKGFVDTLKGKIIIGLAVFILTGAVGGIIYYTVGNTVQKQKEIRIEEKKQKEIDADIQWTNMHLLKMSSSETNEYKIQIKKYLEKNLYGDITIIQIHENSFQKKNGTVMFQVDVTTYGGFVTSYTVRYADKKWSFSFYKDSYDYQKDAEEEGQKDYPAD